jgi:hypothetical protein
MIERLNRCAGIAALCVALLALVFSMTSSAGAKHATPKRKPKPGALVRLGKGHKIPAKYLPVVAHAKRADVLGGDKASADDLTGSCAPEAVDMGSWCLAAATYPLADKDIGRNDFFFATRACVAQGGWLPSAAELLGAAKRVKLSSTIDDSQLTAQIDIDATDGLKDKREMSSTLVTTAAGSSAAGSEGVTSGSRGDPKQGEPDPVPLPANPAPETLQYVMVYDNHDHGGFAGSKPVGQPESFRCAYSKVEGASKQAAG